MDERRAGSGRAGRGRHGGEQRACGEPGRKERERVLAALRRAVLHRRPRRGPAPLWAVLEHLDVPRRSAAARGVRRLLRELERDGLVELRREHSVAVWSVTREGERALARAGEPALPESPRRREWRRARLAAARELPRFHARLAAALAQAEEMLEAAETAMAAGAGAGARTRAAPPRAEAWLELGRELAGDCRRVGSAWHCLHEWAEPAEEVEDPDAAGTVDLAGAGGSGGRAGTGPAEPAGHDDEARRARLAALRNVRLWREQD